MLAVVLLVSFVSAPLAAQTTPEPVDRLGGLDARVLVNVHAVAFRGDDVLVLTDPGPGVHLFTADGYRAFGREGGGPAELDLPLDAVWTADGPVVLDQNAHEIVAYDDDGGLRNTRGLAGEWPDRLYVVGTDTVVGLFTPMVDERAVVRLRAGSRDTVLAYRSRGEEVRLEAEGAPGYRTRHPFTPQVEWTVLADGLLAVWDPDDPEALRLRDLDGAAAGRLGGVSGSHEVVEADREAWLREKFVTSEFMGRRIFEPLLPEARERLRFPDRFPSVLELRADPGGGVWVRKTTSARGEVWTLIDRTGERRGTLRLPAGRELLRVGPRSIAAHATDELEVEYIEIYERPAWAGEVRVSASG